LLDTCVLSELQRPGGSSKVRESVESLGEDEIYLSVITFGEITKGVQRLADGRRKSDLLAWLNGLDRFYSGRLLGIDRETAGIWGEIAARAETQGRVLAASDGLIAATALQHGLRILTRNIADFAITGVLLSNPWD
jgi:predicted nucleic acid-binding protein